jgi:hypothetical protein
MSYMMGQATAPTSATTALFTVPPGLANVTFWNVSGGTVYVGTSAAVTTSDGLQCHSIPTNFSSYVSSKGTTLYGANVSGTAATVNYVIVTGS